MSQLTTRSKKAKTVRRVYIATAVLGFAILLFNALGFHAVPRVVQMVGPQQEELGVAHTGYNFTSYHLEYQLGENTGGGLPEFGERGGANGRPIVCCYKPKNAADPLLVRWSYYGGIYSDTDFNTWHYEAMINPPFPQGRHKSLRLTIRFYPGGRLAARYTDQPEGAYNNTNVSQKLIGQGWVQAQGTPLPALLDKESQPGASGKGSDSEFRPTLPIRVEPGSPGAKS